MNVDMKQKWIEALRGGRYEKCNGILRDSAGKRYCALGVLADICAATLANVQWKVLDGMYAIAYVDCDMYCDLKTASLPEMLRNKLNLTQREVANVMEGNDTLHQSFEQIADWIETNISEDINTAKES